MGLWIWIQLGLWIRIQEKQKMDHKKAKNEEFSCYELLDVLFGGMGVSPIT
jgi:hypothetical protein